MGYRWGESLYDAGSRGGYWSRTLNSSNPYNAYYLYFSSGYVSCYNYTRILGLTVRAVRVSQN